MVDEEIKPKATETAEKVGEEAVEEKAEELEKAD